ncbi:hypothetical protein HWD99_09155 [Microbacterium sp. C5A9]|uniref:hypothetical protein n=1 Tax=Microbacterium sp. C5A9 TaxID=2736663 RepID=UPI001F517A91|nr:hypothetical protein [Microbacterium sp. C5A9]MCI1018790.1 hypothetical protein [Microbacterium sp. C5A9]
MDRLIALLSAQPAEILLALLSQPLFSLAVAALVAIVWRLASRRSAAGGSDLPTTALDETVRARYRPEMIAVRVGAIAVVVSLVLENLTATLTPPDSDAVSWWRYATPLLAGAVSLLALVCLVALRGSSAPRRPVPLAGRRTWATFGTRADLTGAGLAALALTLTAIAAGLASSPDPRGRYVWLEVPIQNASVDPLRPWFFGWAYGVPVLISLAALLVVGVATLHCSAARPFIAPETLRVERNQRSTVASGILRIATGATMLSLAAAWRFIAESGTTTALSIEGDGTYEVAWRYAEFATAAGWGAPAIEVCAFLLLFFATGIRTTRRRSAPLAQQDAEDPLLSLTESER